jgi:Uma2 family endonuclease
MGTTTGLVTVAEFMRIPAKNGVRHELRHGEIVEVRPPPSNHAEIQDRIVDALRAVASTDWKIRAEMAFRPQPEHEVWEADVGVMKRSRWEPAVASSAYPLGAPEVVVEVLSPSNRASEIFDRERTCFEGGCNEFWVVDPERREVRVSTPQTPTRTYGPGEAVPAFDRQIQVNDIFSC